LVAQHAGGIAHRRVPRGVTSLLTDVALKSRRICPTALNGLTLFENRTVATFAHHNKALLTVGNAPRHDGSVVDIIFARSKNRGCRIRVLYRVYFDRACSTGKSHLFRRARDDSECYGSTGSTQEFRNIAAL